MTKHLLTNMVLTMPPTPDCVLANVSSNQVRRSAGLDGHAARQPEYGRRAYCAPDQAPPGSLSLGLLPASPALIGTFAASSTDGLGEYALVAADHQSTRSMQGSLRGEAPEISTGGQLLVSGVALNDYDLSTDIIRSPVERGGDGG